MINYIEILWFRSLGINHSRMAESMGIFRQAVTTAGGSTAAQAYKHQSVIVTSNLEFASGIPY